MRHFILCGLNPDMVGAVSLSYGEGIVGQILRDMHPMRVTCASRQSGYRFIEGLDNNIYESFLKVAIHRGIHKIGVIAIQRDQRRPFSKRDVKNLSYISSQLSSVLETAGTLLHFDDLKTTDGKSVTLLANINLVSDMEGCQADAVARVGLYRSEFPFMLRDHFPTEEEQLKVYEHLMSFVKDREFTFRTLDIGGDKSLPYYDSTAEENPFLGKRAIRFSLSERGRFKEQIKAVLRAGHYTIKGYVSNDTVS